MRRLHVPLISITFGLASLAQGGCVQGGSDEGLDRDVGTDTTYVDGHAEVDETATGETGDLVDVSDEAPPPPDTATFDTADGSACPGLGAYCGSRLGLDATKIYSCDDGKVGTVLHDCGTKKCIEVASDPIADLCPCPDGDGRYCGGRVGGDPLKLYDCKGGAITEALTCALKCNAGSGPTADKCAACPSGDGAYCGVTVGGDKNKLYDCKGGVITVKSDCGAPCVVKPPGTPDTCPGCPSGDGAYCGGPVGLDPNTLYQCTSGVFTVKEKCSGTCYVAAAGSPDYCTTAGAGLLCANIQWWNSALTYGPYMSYGWWDTDLAVPNLSKVQLRHDSRLDKEGVYGWGWMPEFTDMVTGDRFRFLHLQPSAKYATTIGKTYPAGTIVGLSGGASAETGYPKYSTGAHLCVQTLAAYRTAFPAGKDACK
jgi:hypothetical protein